MNVLDQIASTGNRYSEPPFYLFIHIPKNAGTTLRSIVDLQYGVPNTITYYNQPSTQLLENLDAMLSVGLHNYQALIGHYKYGVHEGLSRSFRYVTFLRDPIARAIASYYERLKTETANFTKPDGSILTLGESLILHRNSYDNQQLRFLIGKSEDEVLSSRDVDSAIANLEWDFLFTGLVERFDESILLLSKRAGWKPCTYSALNQGSPHDIDKLDIETVRQLNRYDFILYEYVQEKITSEITEYGAIFRDAFEEWMTERRAMGAGGELKAAADFTAELPRVYQFLSA